MRKPHSSGLSSAVQHSDDERPLFTAWLQPAALLIGLLFAAVVVYSGSRLILGLDSAGDTFTDYALVISFGFLIPFWLLALAYVPRYDFYDTFMRIRKRGKPTREVKYSEITWMSYTRNSLDSRVEIRVGRDAGGVPTSNKRAYFRIPAFPRTNPALRMDLITWVWTTVKPQMARDASSQDKSGQSQTNNHTPNA